MTGPQTRTFVGIAALAVAVAMLALGLRRMHTVYGPGADAEGAYLETVIPDHRLVSDATFSGATVRDGMLFSTYDRTQAAQGKKPCPT